MPDRQTDSPAADPPRLEPVFGIGLVVFAALAAVPLGSTWPVAQAVAAATAGLLGVAYAIARAMVPGDGLARPGAPGWLFAAFVTAAACQLLPFGALFPLPAAGVPVSTITVAAGSTLAMLLQFGALGVLAFMALQAGRFDVLARRAMWAALVLVTAHAIGGIVQLTLLGDTILGMPKWASPGAATGTFVNRNSFAMFLSLGLVVGASLATGMAGARWRRLAALACCLVIAVTIVLTQSRFGFATALLSTLAVVIVGQAGRIGLRRTGLILAAVAAVAIGALALWGPGLLARFAAVEDGAALRLELYRQVWDMILQRPLVGHGAGAFEVAFPMYHRASLPTEAIWASPHNTYLSLWVDLGLVAGSLPLLIVGILLARSWARFRRGGPGAAVGLAGIGAVAVGAIHSLVDFGLEIPANAYLFWVLIGIAGAVPIRDRVTAGGTSARG